MSVSSAELEAFRVVCESISHAHTRANFPTLALSTFTVEAGTRYARIVRSDGGSSRSVHCFVDLTNGDVLKAASWKAPAKHARGNIYQADGGRGALTEYGAKYLK